MVFLPDGPEKPEVLADGGGNAVGGKLVIGVELVLEDVEVGAVPFPKGSLLVAVDVAARGPREDVLVDVAAGAVDPWHKGRRMQTVDRQRKHRQTLKKKRHESVEDMT